MADSAQLKTIPKLLENGVSIPLYPALVVALGDVLKALIVAQVHFCAQKSPVDAQSCAWCELTYDDLAALLGIGWATVQRHVCKLEAKKVLVSKPVRGHGGKAYRVDYAILFDLTGGQSWKPVTPPPSPRPESGEGEGPGRPPVNQGHQNDVGGDDEIHQNDVSDTSNCDTPPHQNDVDGTSNCDTPAPLVVHQNDVAPLYKDSFRDRESLREGGDRPTPSDLDQHPFWVAFCEGWPSGQPTETPTQAIIDALEAKRATPGEITEMVRAKWDEPGRKRYAFEWVAKDLGDWRARPKPLRVGETNGHSGLSENPRPRIRKRPAGLDEAEGAIADCWRMYRTLVETSADTLTRRKWERLVARYVEGELVILWPDRVDRRLANSLERRLWNVFEPVPPVRHVVNYGEDDGGDGNESGESVAAVGEPDRVG